MYIVVLYRNMYTDKFQNRNYATPIEPVALFNDSNSQHANNWSIINGRQLHSERRPAWADLTWLYFDRMRSQTL